MKYKDLPPQELVNKLLATSFNNPTINYSVYEWCTALKDGLGFFENERIKLVQKYGKEDDNGNVKVLQENIEKFSKEFSVLLETDVGKEFPDFPLKKSSFYEENCSFAKDKSMWLSPTDMNIVYKMIEDVKSKYE